MGTSIFVDLDGTLIDFANSPDKIVIGEDLRALLASLERSLGGRFAIVSGRSLDALVALLGSVPKFIAGSHGLEIRGARGVTVQAERPAMLTEVADAMRLFARLRGGLLVEDKPLGVALHFRSAPDLADACRALARELAQATGLVLQLGAMVAEVRAGGGDKGTAIRAIMAELPMAGTRPVYLGDDLTDEPGFVACAALGGAGILVGAARPSAAAYRLRNVAAVRRWLTRAAAARKLNLRHPGMRLTTGHARLPPR